MADNYIERQQEQYEARKAAWKQAQKYGKKKPTTVRPAESKSHTSTVSKPEDSKRRVFITGGAEGIGKAIVEAFSQADCLVAFCDTNDASGFLFTILLCLFPSSFSGFILFLLSFYIIICHDFFFTGKCKI